MSNMKDVQISIGLDVVNTANLETAVKDALDAAYGFVYLPITNSRYKSEFVSGKATERSGPFTRSELVLPQAHWQNLVVGKLSAHADVDSTILRYRKNSEEIIHQELSFASHLVLPAVTCTLKSSKCTNLARIIYDKIAKNIAGQFSIWVEVPMENPTVGAIHLRQDDEEIEPEDTWKWWNKFHTLCNFNNKVGVVLEVSADLPSQENIDRWAGEPVRCLVLNTSIFQTNQKGYPTLSRAHQEMFRTFAAINVQTVIRGTDKHSGISYYQQYIQNLYRSFKHDQNHEYQDILQVPLQPLSDNLDSCTYEVFEKDPVKYDQYESAIGKAMLHQISKGDRSSETILIVMVVGAGRGPLVRAALNASTRTQIQVKIYAIEKNPNAIVTLQAQALENWPSNVTVVPVDMREFHPPELADILVSELLGSFGDNELSPECLDGAQKLLKSDGISIPQSYTSFISPVQSSNCYCKARIDSMEPGAVKGSGLETPFVVNITNKYVIAPPQPLFVFNHPNRDKVMDNTRHSEVTFGPITQDCVLHGFVGYFDSVLYNEIKLSIVPETHTPTMFSWFPVYFPIRKPIYLKAGECLTVEFWRCVDKSKVWYEWAVTEPTRDCIHNGNGRHYSISL